MIDKTYLILDTNYLCHRAFWQLGGLQFRGELTGVLYGVLRDVAYLRQLHLSENLIFCFDPRSSLREQVCSKYKASRKVDESRLSETDIKIKTAFYRQIYDLQNKFLYEAGFQNVFCAEGYEADDLIASLCKYTLKNEDKIIVSGDGDLYQLLNKYTSIWNPRQKHLITAKSFKTLYNIEPKQWALAKAIMGCHTDDIKGVVGIGEVYALRYLRGELKESSDKYKTIKNNWDLVEFNLQLTKLPYKGVPRYKLKQDETSEKKWQALMTKLQMPSLKDKWKG